MGRRAFSPEFKLEAVKIDSSMAIVMHALPGYGSPLLPQVGDFVLASAIALAPQPRH